MREAASRTIRIAAALIDEEAGRVLLVRKTGTRWFMQAGGKIEAGETALAALQRELAEDIGLEVCAQDVRHLGCFSASAANEHNMIVEAELFHIRVRHAPMAQAEIAEAIWVSAADAAGLPLAPLTRYVVLPLVRTL
ncbi:NUDIX domain-containing protein [Sphingomonas populi]|uniref:NUDIX domain-containing protein n=1 Tax=Sphingomonas populi TaxID=2484750 RepID=A0A4Q6XV76_9SPHN|nr:NUDIX domain-containing protein [Sphingomonas populi]RZF60789.1 NUDIX domain-containing protein [Sphingomonas populi]